MLSRQLLTKALIFGLFWAGLSSSCVRKGEDELSQAKIEAEGKRFETALSYLEKAMAKLRGKESALSVASEAAKISFFELKDYPRALEYYQYIAKHSPDTTTRLEAQKQIINIYSNHLVDHKKTISEIYKLKEHLQESSEKLKYRILLAKAYFYLNDFYQAESEVDEYLTQNPPGDYRFDLLLMKANIQTARKQPENAAKVLQQIQSEFPGRSEKEGIGLMLAVALEESGQYERAIEVLEKLKQGTTSPEQFDLRIQRLKDRYTNAPGRLGRRK